MAVARHKDTGELFGLEFEFSIVDPEETDRWECLADLADYIDSEADGWPADAVVRDLAIAGKIRVRDAVHDLPGSSRLGAILV